MIVLIESETMKCKTCGKEKEQADFPKRHKECKVCNRKRSLSWRHKNIERARENARRWNHEHLELRAIREQERRKTARERQRLINKASYEKHKEKRLREHKEFVSSHPEQSASRNEVKKAIRNGVLTRPKECSRCGDIGRVHAHHDDYRQPLDVRWLCSACHLAFHKRKYRIAAENRIILREDSNEA